jgi:hypothetical protein
MQRIISQSTFPYSEATLGLVPLEWGGLMFHFFVEHVYLSRIQLSLVSGPCGYVAPICGWEVRASGVE